MAVGIAGRPRQAEAPIANNVRREIVLSNEDSLYCTGDAVPQPVRSTLGNYGTFIASQAKPRESVDFHNLEAKAQDSQCAVKCRLAVCDALETC
jgi:hypothetical protein